MTETFQQIRAILLSDWDPAGVRNNPAAQGEYDGHLPRLHDLLRKTPTPRLEAELVRYLSSVETERMGLQASPGTLIAARKLALLELPPSEAAADDQPPRTSERNASPLSSKLR